mgnify:CR=1 FL=1
MNRFRVSTQLARKLAELGVPPAAVLRHAGLPAGLFDQERILVSTEELFALYRGIASASDDPAIGLRLGTEPRVERYDPIALTAVSARSLRDALARLEAQLGLELFDRSGRAIAAMNISGQAARTSARHMVEQFLPRLQAASAQISLTPTAA